MPTVAKRVLVLRGGIHDGVRYDWSPEGVPPPALQVPRKPGIPARIADDPIGLILHDVDVMHYDRERVIETGPGGGRTQVVYYLVRKGEA